MKSKKEIYACYDNKYIRLYMACSKEVAEEADKLGKFGEMYNKNKMTWVNPSFLWIMERSHWGRKKNQERILAVDLLREGFDGLLEQAVLTSNESCVYKTAEEWEKAYEEADVYCQWDADKNVYGSSIDKMALQIGIKGRALNSFLDNYIVDLFDITPYVNKWKKKLDNYSLNEENLPKEKLYLVTDKIKAKLGVIEEEDVCLAAN